ncbi:MAG: hypothetical protein GY845_03540 [Planctomycetes bacterium]|nr:hypothetical protein [Planctomycetota bacterium]
MSNKIPQNIAKVIKEIVFAEADRVDYLAMARTDSGAFINGLVARSDVGDEIAKYINRAGIRHYIKDSILNRYSKVKTEEATPKDLKSIVHAVFDFEAEESHRKTKLCLYKSISLERPHEYVVISEGTFLKWETALKKALMFISGMPFSKTAKEVHILLLLFAQHSPLTPSDKQHLEAALARCGAKPHVYGEG